LHILVFHYIDYTCILNSPSSIKRKTWIFVSPGILRLFTEYGDIDYPSRLARELFKRPSLWAKLLSIIPAREILISLFRLIFG